MDCITYSNYQLLYPRPHHRKVANHIHGTYLSVNDLDRQLYDHEKKVEEHLYPLVISFLMFKLFEYHTSLD